MTNMQYPTHEQFAECLALIDEHLNGAPKPEWFNDGQGLCFNFSNYLANLQGVWNSSDFKLPIYEWLRKTHFEGLFFPFRQQKTANLYTNPKRLAFIQKHKANRDAQQLRQDAPQSL